MSFLLIFFLFKQLSYCPFLVIFLCFLSGLLQNCMLSFCNNIFFAEILPFFDIENAVIFGASSNQLVSYCMQWSFPDTVILANIFQLKKQYEKIVVCTIFSIYAKINCSTLNTFWVLYSTVFCLVVNLQMIYWDISI